MNATPEPRLVQFLECFTKTMNAVEAIDDRPTRAQALPNTASQC
jgi:hypothetical protein